MPLCSSRSCDEPHLVCRAGHFGLLADELLGALQQHGGVAAGFGDDAPGQAVRLLQQGLHEVLGFHDLVAASTERSEPLGVQHSVVSEQPKSLHALGLGC